MSFLHFKWHAKKLHVFKACNLMKFDTWNHHHNLNYGQIHPPSTCVFSAADALEIHLNFLKFYTNGIPSFSLYSLRIVILKSIHVVSIKSHCILFWIVFHCMDIPQFVLPKSRFYGSVCLCFYETTKISPKEFSLLCTSTVKFNILSNIQYGQSFRF
jgi:hypothetical protein